jgi:hypothetical protein
MEVDGWGAEDYRFWSSQGTVPEADRGHDVYAGGALVRTPEYSSPEQAGLRVRTSTPVPVPNRSMSFSMNCWQVLRQ